MLNDARSSRSGSDSCRAFNLNPILRKLLGAGTPREMKTRAASLIFASAFGDCTPVSPETALELGSALIATAPAVIRPIKLCPRNA
jgi:hypothetical protein